MRSHAFIAFTVLGRTVHWEGHGKDGVFDLGMNMTSTHNGLDGCYDRKARQSLGGMAVMIMMFLGFLTSGLSFLRVLVGMASS